MFFRSRLVGLFVLPMLLTACQTTGSGETTYNFLFTPADHISELVEANDLKQAQYVYVRQREFFVGAEGDEEGSNSNLLQSSEEELGKAEKAIVVFADAVKREHYPSLRGVNTKLNNLADWPANPSTWKEYESALRKSEDALDNYSTFSFLEDFNLRPDEFDQLSNKRANLKKEIIQSALEEFQKYDISSGPVFFSAYPVSHEIRNLLKDNKGVVVSKLEGLTAGELKTFSISYSDWLGNEFDAELAAHYYRSAIGASDKTGFPKILDAAISTERAGFKLDDIPEVSVSAIEVTSKTLLEQGQIEFPIAIENDLPFSLERAELDDVFKKPQVKDADVVILIDVAAARNNRKVSKADVTPSEYQSGTRTEANPNYAMAQTEVNNAQLEVQRAAMNTASANAQWCYGLGCLGKAASQLAAGIAEAAAQEELQAAMNTFSSTPMQVTKPVYTKYNFRRVTLEAAKETTVNFYVIDRLENKYLKSEFDAVETQPFTVAYGIHEEDRYKHKHLSKSDKEEDVVEFEETEISVKLSDLLGEYTGQISNAKKLPSVTSIRKQILQDKNKALAEFKKNQFEIAPDKDDPRFDSVVVVYHPGGGIGTGFYVRDDLILTNYHVIEGSQFVEMKLFNGQETFGKVIANDIRLDLALIKSQARGKPVEFYSSNSLPQGKTVEVIGHPEGLEFSISRGIVSSLREISSRYVPGGKKVRFVQTDAAINPGNSGGPMFLGLYVVGVNTQKLAATELEGLSFAIHYADVVSFLEQNSIVPGS